ncbi:hypothetical protein M4951_15025 [Blastopirellula sp. J2-11]|uniref:hypothetical protein n=1 Tax=Blastopirellula sp. J2-11 TaxID=2943192 RepID=UPI0021C6D4B0|nr:hypothetical protein [Blastopirellula sp. J2-11]UUO04700.1 hypothetical protein M4951_15025 [Blastopirellula sp. J2-11]
MLYSRLMSGLLAAIVLTQVGCGARGPEMGDVTGTVTYKGKPLHTGTITFIPEEEGLPLAYAEIQSDGVYEGFTEEFGKGVPVGKHRIMIMAVQENGPEAAAIALLPPKYGSDRQSGLTAEVVGGENKIDFTLK